MASRSLLLGVEPVGRGTRLVEHLGSVVLRTAWRNGLAPGRMIREVAATALGPDENGRFAARRLEQAFRSASLGLLGWDAPAATWIDTFEMLTGRGDLGGLTLRRWANVLPVRGLIHAERAFCPLHLREWREAGVPAYEPLLWQIGVVDTCAHHGIELETRCPDPDCAARRRGLTASAVPGVCHRCGAGLWAVEPRPVVGSADVVAWRLWSARQVENMVATSVEAGFAPNRLAEAVSLAAERAGETLTGLADRLGVALSTVSLWKDDRRQPSLECLLRVARAAGFDLVDILNGSVANLRRAAPPDGRPWLPEREAPYRYIDWGPIRGALRRAAAGQGRVSPAALCDRYGVDRAQARRRYPELYHAASDRFVTRRRQRAWAQQAEGRRHTLEVMRQIDAEGLYPSKRRTQLRLGRRVDYGSFGAIWREGLSELGYRKSDDPGAPCAARDRVTEST